MDIEDRSVKKYLLDLIRHRFLQKLILISLFCDLLFTCLDCFTILLDIKV